tara:strand:- start:442 stop:1107 length:666 start_codon:yes stop_codon:yes gene_type:complete
VKNQSFYFEIRDVMTQFVAAFNDVVINRYNKDKSIADQIKVRFLYAPKERVMHDLVNKAQHITLPAVAVNITSVARDESRVFNKILGVYDNPNKTLESNYLPTPVPVNIEVSMSIMTRFQTDMDQIVSNFVPYSNPYIILSWPVPSGIISDLREIRSEVLWNGSISMEYPVELQSSQPTRVTGDTSFTIKGWLFPHSPATTTKNIYYINTNITAVTGLEYM